MFFYIDGISNCIKEISHGQYISVFDHDLFRRINDLHDRYLLNFGLYINIDECRSDFAKWPDSYFEEVSACNWIKWGWKKHASNTQKETAEDISSFVRTCDWIKEKFGEEGLLDSVMLHDADVVPYFKVFHDYHMHIVLMDEWITPNHFSDDLIARWDDLRELSLEFVWRKKDIDFDKIIDDINGEALALKVSQILDAYILNNIRVSISERNFACAYSDIELWLDMLENRRIGYKTKAAVFPNVACIHDGVMFFSTHRDNYIYKYEFVEGIVSPIAEFKSETIGQTNFSAVYYYRDCLIFTPCVSDKIVIYDTKTQKEVFFTVPNCNCKKDGKWNFIKGVRTESSIWFASARELRLIEFELDTHEFHVHSNWPREIFLTENGVPFSQIQCLDDVLFLFPKACNSGIKYNLVNGDMEIWECDNNNNGKVIYNNILYQENESVPTDKNARSRYWHPLIDGERIYFCPFDAGKLLYLDINTNTYLVKEISTRSYNSTSASFPMYASYEMISYNEKVYLIPMFNNLLVGYDKEKDCLFYDCLFRKYSDVVADRLFKNIYTNFYEESEMLNLTKFIKII